MAQKLILIALRCVLYTQCIPQHEICILRSGNFCTQNVLRDVWCSAGGGHLENGLFIDEAEQIYLFMLFFT